MDHIEKEIKVADVITRKLLVGEEISEQEEAALRGWLEESERHRAWFREYREKLPLGEFEEVVQISDVKEQWQKLDQLTKERKHIGWRKWSAYARELLCCCLLDSGGEYNGKRWKSLLREWP
ncbi:MAG: hypothetical protein ACLTZT_05015 [Butyricimonas faecalis]